MPPAPNTSNRPSATHRPVSEGPEVSSTGKPVGAVVGPKEASGSLGLMVTKPPTPPLGLAEGLGEEEACAEAEGDADGEGDGLADDIGGRVTKVMPLVALGLAVAQMEDEIPLVLAVDVGVMMEPDCV